jgi:putative transport protein
VVQAFIENPILLLFFVMALGYGLGRIRIGNFKPGVAAVLFLGLGIGALNPQLRLPESMIYFGLALFVYSIGLSSGPGFFSAIKLHGLRDIGFVFILLCLTVTIAVGLHFFLGLDAQDTAGLYAGSTTNTPALAGLIDLIGQKDLQPDVEALVTEEAVASYSLAYPVGIMGTILALYLMQRIYRVDYKKEAVTLKDMYPIGKEIINRSIEITNKDINGTSIRDLKKEYQLRVVFGRRLRNGQSALTHWDSSLMVGDKTIIVGDLEDVDQATRLLGRKLEEDLATDASEYVQKRIFVSNANIAGQKLSTLNIGEKFLAIVTQIRRGDMELLANQSTVLEFGDIVQFVTRRKDTDALARFFGDSYESLSRINLFSFGLGLSLGLLLGMVTFQLPGDVSFRLGFAGGPILVALILGALRRTGPIVWTLPFSANLTFQQLGLAILLGGIGINSGHTFVETIGQGTWMPVIAAAAIISFLSASIAFVLGYKFLKIPFSIMAGMVSHQPAILDYSIQQADNKLPTIGYTVMLPIALILKILFVQLLFIFLQ